jgi:hypothetical protein
MKYAQQTQKRGATSTKVGRFLAAGRRQCHLRAVADSGDDAREYRGASMSERTRRCVLSLFGAMLLAASPVMAQSGPDLPHIPGPDYGVATTPAVYFVNFLFMYFANPANAANMPAYRAPVPPEVATCLLANPDGCKFKDLERFFNDQNPCSDGNGGDKCRFDLQCKVEPSFEHLAPPNFSTPDQINEPLGMAKAAFSNLRSGQHFG